MNTDILDQIYRNSQQDRQRSLAMAEDLMSGLGRKSFFPSYLERVYAPRPQDFSSMRLPAISPYSNMPEQGSQVSVSQADAEESVRRAISSINSLLEQPGLSEAEKSRLVGERDALLGSMLPGGGGGWWGSIKNLGGLFLKGLDYLSRPLQLVHEGALGLATGVSNLITGEDRRGPSLTNMWNTLMGRYELNAQDNPELFGDDGMMFASDVLSSFGWEPVNQAGEGTGVDWSSPVDVLAATGRFVVSMGLDVAADPLARVTFGSTLAGAKGRAAAALHAWDRAVSISAARIAERRGLPEIVARQALGNDTLAHYISGMPRFAEHPFTRRVELLLERNYDDAARSTLDRQVEALRQAGLDPDSLPWVQQGAAAQKAAGAADDKVSKVVDMFDPATTAAADMDTAVRNLFREVGEKGPVSTPLWRATYEAAVRRRFFEMDADFKSLTRLGMKEGLPAYMAGGIRIGSVSGNHGWFYVPGTSGLGGRLREATFGRAWKAVSEKFPTLGHLAQTLDKSFANGLGRGHRLTWQARRGTSAIMEAVENKIVPMIDLLRRQAMARLNFATAKVASLAAKRGVDFGTVEREITEYLTDPAARQEFRSRSRLFGGNEDVHAAALEEADLIGNTYREFFNKAREYNPDIGEISDYVPTVTKEWWRRVAMMLADDAQVVVDPNRGAGFQILSDLLAAQRVKTSYSQVGYAPAMQAREMGKAVIRLWPTEVDAPIAALIPVDNPLRGQVVFASPIELNKLVGEALQAVIDENPHLRLPKLAAEDLIEAADGTLVPRLFEDSSAALIRGYVSSMGDAIRDWALVSEWEKMGAVVLSTIGKDRAVKAQEIVARLFAGDWDGDELVKHVRSIIAVGVEPSAVEKRMVQVPIVDGVTVEMWEPLARNKKVQAAVKALARALKDPKVTGAPAVERRRIAVDMFTKAVEKGGKLGWSKQIAEMMADIAPEEVWAFASVLEHQAGKMADELQEAVNRWLREAGPVAAVAARRGNVQDVLEKRMAAIRRSGDGTVKQLQNRIVARLMKLQQDGTVLARQRVTVESPVRVPVSEELGELAEAEWRAVTLDEAAFNEFAAAVWDAVEMRRGQMLQRITEEIDEYEAARKMGIEFGFGDANRTRLVYVDGAIANAKQDIREYSKELKDLRGGKKPPEYEVPRGDLFTQEEGALLAVAIRGYMDGDANKVKQTLAVIADLRARRGQPPLPADVEQQLRPYKPGTVGVHGLIGEFDMLLRNARDDLAKLTKEREELIGAMRLDMQSGRRIEKLLTMRRLLTEGSRDQQAAATIWLDYAHRWRLWASASAAEEMEHIVQAGGGWKPWKGEYEGRLVDWSAAEVERRANDLMDRLFSQGDLPIGSQDYFQFPPLKAQVEDEIAKGHVTPVALQDLADNGYIPKTWLAGEIPEDPGVRAAIIIGHLWNKEAEPRLNAWTTAEAVRKAQLDQGYWGEEVIRLAEGAVDLAAAQAKIKGKGRRPYFVLKRTKSNRQIQRDAELDAASKMYATLARARDLPYDSPDLLRHIAMYRVYGQTGKSRKMLRRWWLEARFTAAAWPDGRPVEYTDEACAELAKIGDIPLSEVKEVRDWAMSLEQQPAPDTALLTSVDAGDKLLPTADVLASAGIIGPKMAYAESRIREMEQFMWDATTEGATVPRVLPTVPQYKGRLALPASAFEPDPNYPLMPTMADRYYAQVSEFVGRFHGLILQPYRNPDGTWTLTAIRSTPFDRKLADMTEETMRARWKAAGAAIPDPVGGDGKLRASVGGKPWYHTTKVVSDKYPEPAWNHLFDDERFTRNTRDLNSYVGQHFHSDETAAQGMIHDLHPGVAPTEPLAVYQVTVDATRIRVYGPEGPIRDGLPMDRWGPSYDTVQNELEAPRAWATPRAEAHLNQDIFAALIRLGELAEHPDWYLPRQVADIIAGKPSDMPESAVRMVMERIPEMARALKADDKMTILDWIGTQPDIVETFMREAEGYGWSWQERVCSEFNIYLAGAIGSGTLKTGQAKKRAADTFNLWLHRNGYEAVSYWNAVEKPPELGGTAATVGAIKAATVPEQVTSAERKMLMDQAFQGLPRQDRQRLESLLAELEKTRGRERLEAMSQFKKELAEARRRQPEVRQLGSWSLIVPPNSDRLVKPAYTLEPSEVPRVKYEAVKVGKSDVERVVERLVAHVRANRITDMAEPGGAERRLFGDVILEAGDTAASQRNASIVNAIYNDPACRRMVETIGGMDDVIDSYRTAYNQVKGGLDQLAPDDPTVQALGPKLGAVKEAAAAAPAFSDAWDRVRAALVRGVTGEDRRALWHSLFERKDGKWVANADAQLLRRQLKRVAPDAWERLSMTAEYLRVSQDIRDLPDGFRLADEVEKAYHLRMNQAHLLNPDEAEKNLYATMAEMTRQIEDQSMGPAQEALKVCRDFVDRYTAFFDKFVVESGPDGKPNLRAATLVDAADEMEPELRAMRKDLKALRQKNLISQKQYDRAQKALKSGDDITTLQNRPGFSRPSVKGLGTGPLEGKLAIPEVTAWFENYARISQRMWHGRGVEWAARKYQAWYGWFKSMVTVGNFLSFIPRNLQGGFWNNLLIGVRAGDYARAARLLHYFERARREAADKAIEMWDTVAWKKMNEVEQRTVWHAYEQGIFDTFASTEFARAMEGLAPLTTMKGFLASLKVWNRREALQVRTGVKLMQQSENFLRLAPFVRYYDDTIPGSEKMAATMSFASNFDYSDLTNVERWVKDHLIPFYVWGRHNLELQFRAAMERPEMVLRYYKLMYNLQENFGGGEDKDRFLHPDYWGTMPAGTGLILNGDTPYWARMFISFDLPIEDLFDFTDVVADGISITGLASYLGNLLGPQVETPVSFLADASRQDPYSVNAPIGLLQALKLTNRLGITRATESPEGDVRIPSWMRELYYTAFPFVQPTFGAWVEPFAPTDPKMAQRYGYVPGEDRDWGDRFTAFLIRNARGLGVRFSTPADTASAVYPLTVELNEMREELEYQNLWVQAPDSPGSGLDIPSGPTWQRIVSRVLGG